MSAGRIYWGQILIVLGAVALGAISAAQWTAHQLGYQAALGAPDAFILGAPVYAPWRFLVWWYHYDTYARKIFEQGALIFLGATAGAIAAAFLFSLWRSREAKSSDTYGTARWARTEEVRKLGLTSGDGVVLGTWDRQILRHDGDEHVLVVAPTNTGKSVGISLPTGLVWRHSFIALDLKGENWRVTSGLRSSFGPVFRFEPTSTATHRYNPLTQIRRGETEVRDTQVLADMLVDPEGALGTRNHWQLRAFELLVAAILWTLYVEKRKTLARLAELLADPERPILELLEEMLHHPILNNAPHPVVAAGARQLLDMAEAERSGVVSTALGYLALYRDPVLARATEVSDFSIADLIEGPRPVSLYLVAPPEELSRLKALLRLVLNQVLKRLTEIAGRHVEASNGRRVLLMLDEFPQLGRLDFFEHALAYIRGYGIKACLVAQSLNQIVQAYGEHSSILDNAHIRVAFACNDDRTAKRLSDMLGVTTETRAQMNYAGSRMAPWLGHTMVSRQEVPRALLTPGEIMQLPPDEALVFVGGSPPIRARKLRYFAEPALQSRVRPAIEVLAQEGPGTRTSWDDVVPPPVPTPPSAKPASRRPPRSARAHDAAQPAFAFSPGAAAGDARVEAAAASVLAPLPADDELDAAIAAQFVSHPNNQDPGF
ncbi:MAG: IncP-type conjugal transfer protein TraG [Alphaproteobacteria bacterium]|nr:IncP-type conjugal transfer protein TraG [Alphaproteobacteria bacterium]